MPPSNAADEAITSESRLDFLEGHIKIDRNRLEDAFETQAAYYLDVTKGVATAISYRDRAKADLELIEAEEDRTIREAESRAVTAALAADSKAKPGKMTEGAIKALIVECNTYQDAKKLLLRWTYLVNRWSGLQESFSQRHFALKEMVNLYCAGYWRTDGSAGPRIPPENRGESNYAAVRERVAQDRAARPPSQPRERLNKDEAVG